MLLFHQNLQAAGGGSPLSRTVGTRVSSNGTTVTSGSMVIPDNSLVVLITKTMRDTSDVSPLTITNSGTAATWTERVVTPSQSDQYSQRIWFHTAYFTTGGTFTFTATAASAPPGGFSALTLLPIVYQNASSTLGVSGSANNGPTDGAWTPSLSGAPAATSDVLAAFTATVSGSGDLYQTDGSGVTRLDTANAAGVYGGSVSVRTGSTTASYTWDDVLAPSSTDSIYLNSVYAALEIKQASGGSSVNGSASAALSGVSTSAAAASAAGTASATGSLTGATLTAATGAASGGTVINGSASAALTGVSTSAAAASATGTAAATGALTGVSIAAVLGSASGGTVINGNASASLAAVSAAAVSGAAAGTAAAAGSLVGVTLSPANGSASGGTVVNGSASASLAGVTLTPANGSASGATVINGSASATLAGVTISPTTSTAAGTATAVGSLAGVALVAATCDAPTGTAGSTLINGGKPYKTTPWNWVPFNPVPARRPRKKRNAAILFLGY